MNKSVKIIVSGKVQGVGYRDWARKQARKLGLSGWVRNLKGGTVEALLSGDDYAINEMLRKCGYGPPLAEVTGIESISADLPEERGFHILPTV